MTCHLDGLRFPAPAWILGGAPVDDGVPHAVGLDVPSHAPEPGPGGWTPAPHPVHDPLMEAAAADASQRERGDDVAHAVSSEGSGLPVTARYCLAQSPAGGTSRLAPRHLPTCKRDQLRCVDEVRSHQPARPHDLRCNFCPAIAGALVLPCLCCHPCWRRHAGGPRARLGS